VTFSEICDFCGKEETRLYEYDHNKICHNCLKKELRESMKFRLSDKTLNSSYDYWLLFAKELENYFDNMLGCQEPKCDFMSKFSDRTQPGKDYRCLFAIATEEDYNDNYSRSTFCGMMCYEKSKSINVCEFIVLEKYRSLGVGKLMINHLRDVYQGRKIFLGTPAQNTRALKFYQDNGFKIEGYSLQG